MAKRTSPTAIGVFVLGSLALIVAAVAVLGSGRLFRKEHRFVCFFSGSLNGLKVGAPVKVRGVQIGSVEKILLRLPQSDGTLKSEAAPLTALPVVMEVDESQLRGLGGTGEAFKPGELDNLIRRGLRAQLNMESILTGLLYIELNLHPGTPVNLALEPGTAKYPEIPTIPTSFEKIQFAAARALAKLDKIDFEALVSSMTEAASSANQLLSSSDLKATVGSLKATSDNLSQTITAINRQIAALNSKADPLIDSMKKTSDSADLALQQTKSAMAAMQAVIAPDSTLAYRLDLALDNLSEASNAIRQLADYLQRNPSAIVRGRYAPESRP